MLIGEYGGATAGQNSPVKSLPMAMMDTSSLPTSAPLSQRRIERPRPLKSCTDPVLSKVCHQAEDVMALMETVCRYLDSENYHESVVSAVIHLNASIKQFGPQLQADFQNRLEPCMMSLQKACAVSALDMAARLHLLEILELGAMNWMPNDKVTQYYQAKLKQLEVERSAAAAASSQPGTPPQPAESQRSSWNLQAPVFTPSTTSSAAAAAAAAASSSGPALSSSGGGGAAQPAVISSHSTTMVKQQIRIQNSDSGKVSAGAKERLVHISGSDQVKVQRAKSMIQDAILGLHQQAAPHNPTDCARGRQEYVLTVRVGHQCLSISGTNALLVEAAKCVLDAHFSDKKPTDGSAAASARCLSARVSMQQQQQCQEVMLAEQQTKERRQCHLSRTTQSAAASDDATANSNRALIMSLARSPFSQKPPANWDMIAAKHPQIAKKVNEPLVDGVSMAEAAKGWRHGRDSLLASWSPAAASSCSLQLTNTRN